MKCRGFELGKHTYCEPRQARLAWHAWLLKKNYDCQASDF